MLMKILLFQLQQSLQPFNRLKKMSILNDGNKLCNRSLTNYKTRKPRNQLSYPLIGRLLKDAGYTRLNICLINHLSIKLDGSLKVFNSAQGWILVKRLPIPQTLLLITYYQLQLPKWTGRQSNGTLSQLTQMLRYTTRSIFNNLLDLRTQNVQNQYADA